MRREPRYVLRGGPRLAEEFTNELLPKGHAETENGKDKTYTIDNQNICRHPLISHRASINSLLANTGLARNLPRHGQHAARPCSNPFSKSCSSSIPTHTRTKLSMLPTVRRAFSPLSP